MLPLILALACTSPDPKDSPTPDQDNDGTPTDQDCNDNDPNISPSAIEICDDKDNNCDDQIDEGVVGTYYIDQDGDNYGNPNRATTACSAPEGYIETSGDCDDNNRRINPAATETCDGEDDDCSGTIDDNASDATDWYPDQDGDGYGEDTGLIRACEPITNGVLTGGDCDDTDPTTHPGAEESCEENIDRNCDGSSAYSDLDEDGFGACEECDDKDPLINPAADELCNDQDDDCNGLTDDDPADGGVWYPDNDGDGYGATNAPTRACTRPTGFIVDASDCNDTSAQSFPGAPERCDGTDNDCDGTIDDNAIDATTWYRDQDNDGYGDPTSTSTACTQPASYVSNDDDCNSATNTIYPGATEVCDAFDNDCDSLTDEPDAIDATTWYYDGDGDNYGDSAVSTTACTAPASYVGSSGDCNGGNALIYPGAVESCDNQDNDCDGTIDESGASGTGVWYRDQDGDGYGSAASSMNSCNQPAGYVTDATDCNDGESGVNPAAQEVCDGIDNDCDGQSDESSATNALTWYRDADNDGYGTPSTSTTACSAPAGYAGTSSDCDDGNAAVYPGASEICDGSDQDCDGQSDEGALDALDWYGDSDSDGYGTAALYSRSCSQPANYVSNNQDCDDGNPAINPTETEVCNGLDDDCDGLTDDASATDDAVWYRDSDSDGFGSSTSSVVSCTTPAGYVSNFSDCNDASNSIYPGADETCDGIDQDCDGTADDNPIDGTIYYVDGDGDGYGENGSDTSWCTQPSSWVAIDGDCDDNEETINPEAWEVCDGVDEDCNGTIDDVMPQFADSDGDGFGDPNSYIYDCSLQSGYVYEDFSDCNDALATVHPYAYELIADGVDNDCDGAADTADTSLTYSLTLSDDGYATVTFGDFVFPLCGVEYTTAYMIANGRVTFQTADTDTSESVVDLASDRMIAPLWDDFNPASGSPAIAVVDHDDAIGFYWRNLREYTYTTTSTFSLVIFEDGRMMMEYGSVAALDGLTGWSCAPGGNPVEQDLTATYAARTSGAWGLGESDETAMYELFAASDNDLDNKIIRFCGGSGLDLDLDGWSDACGDMDDLDASVYPPF